MTREIKYRAWLKEYQKMIQVIDLDFEYQQIGIDDFKSREYGTYLFINFRNIELMQYTGLKDKNGIEIYEGDIVRTYRLNADKYLEDRTREYDEFIGVVVWNEEYLEYYIQKNSNEYEDLLKPFERDYEVIGNIYENKELLNE